MNVKKILNNLEGYFCVGSLAVMSVVIFWQVVCRYVLKSSLPWSEELSRYLLVWTSFIGGAYGVRLGAHIGVEAFTLLLPKKAQEGSCYISYDSMYNSLLLYLQVWFPDCSDTAC